MFLENETCHTESHNMTHLDTFSRCIRICVFFPRDLPRSKKCDLFRYIRVVRLCESIVRSDYR